jgi:hypothetical protein
MIDLVALFFMFWVSGTPEKSWVMKVTGARCNELETKELNGYIIMFGTVRMASQEKETLYQ